MSILRMDSKLIRVWAILSHNKNKVVSYEKITLFVSKSDYVNPNTCNGYARAIIARLRKFGLDIGNVSGRGYILNV